MFIKFAFFTFFLLMVVRFYTSDYMLLSSLVYLQRKYQFINRYILGILLVQLN